MKVGDRIELVWTDDPYTSLRPGDRGEVTLVGRSMRYVDDQQIGVRWDNGSTLGLIEGRDRYKIIKEER